MLQFCSKGGITMKLKRWIAGILSLGMLAAAPLSGFPAAAESAVTGDVDGSSEVDLLDLVMLQKWMLGAGELSAPENADLNADRSLDIFDLGILKQWLVYGIKPHFYARNLTDGIRAGDSRGLEADEEFILGQTKFALSFLQKTAEDGRNVLVSPYSMTQALAMTANGAKGDTLSEMENVLGGTSIDKLNRYLYTQRMNQPDEDTCKLLTANSIWIRDDADRIRVEDPFLQKNADYYDAAAFMAPFDQTTVRDINTWVDANTDHMIPKLLNEIKDGEVMALINAVTFDAKWASPYSEYQVHDVPFTAYDGTEQTASMLCGEEHLYLEDAHAVGFMKPYQGGRYAFAALLPEEGMTTTEYIRSLTPEHLHELLAEPVSDGVVITQLPKFSYDYSEELSKHFAAMGMPTAFTGTADFSDMAWTESGYLFIGSLLQKTHISVDEDGTRAAAVSAVMMSNDACFLGEPKEVILDRPFVYCIVDRETSLPVFIGTLEKLET